MIDAIKNFHKQFSFSPEVVNGGELKSARNFIIAGMGGSGHSADLLKEAMPELNIFVHRNYGIPVLSDINDIETLFIASSYSGNTEESLDFAEKVHKKGYSLAVIGTGGKLIEFAKHNGVAYVVLPDTGIQPRSGLGFSMLGMVKLMGLENVLGELSKLETSLNPIRFEQQGSDLAEVLSDHVPIIYASERNSSVSNNWKIKFNETAKIPAFYNIFPELNHNEMNGFDYTDENIQLSKLFSFIFLSDDEDNERIKKRMRVTEQMFEKRGLSVTRLLLEGTTRFERIFNSLLLADWTSLYVAREYNSVPDEVPMIEEFKKLLA